jgi:Mrp family chromosome partitioning ATPase
MAGVGLMKSALNRPRRDYSLDVVGGRHMVRRSVVMVTSPGSEATRASVVLNLATVCAEIGQRVVVIETSGIEVHDGPKQPGIAGLPVDDEASRRLTAPLKSSDVRDFLGGTNVPGVTLLDMRHFVAHPTQVVTRVPEVLDALRDLVDVVILDVPSFLTVHHGQGLAPLADAVLVVGERRVTTLDQLRTTKVILKRLEAPVVGLALTNEPPRPDEWADYDREVQETKKRRNEKRTRYEPESASAALPGDAEDTSAKHRRRRTVVEHPPVEISGGIEFPTDRESATLPEA